MITPTDHRDSRGCRGETPTAVQSGHLTGLQAARYPNNAADVDIFVDAAIYAYCPQYG
jgi:hypothetical protein